MDFKAKISKEYLLFQIITTVGIIYKTFFELSGYELLIFKSFVYE